MKRQVLAAVSVVLVLSLCGGCVKPNKNQITVLSREEGSGTRGAFVSLFSVTESVRGKSVDAITDYAEITNSNAVMLTSVKGNVGAIGYVSLGALNNSVKALKIDGAEPTTANIRGGIYNVTRNFNVVLPKNISKTAEDFITFVLSSRGQKIAEKMGYVSGGCMGEYISHNLSGRVNIGGSSSVAPLMQKLKEGYEKLNPRVVIEIQESDSTTGINGALEGSFHIGLSSRELTQQEIAEGLTTQVIATDGIAVIVNKQNPLEELSTEQVKNIYSGNFKNWGELR